MVVPPIQGLEFIGAYPGLRSCRRLPRALLPGPVGAKTRLFKHGLISVSLNSGKGTADVADHEQVGGKAGVTRKVRIYMAFKIRVIRGSHSRLHAKTVQFVHGSGPGNLVGKMSHSGSNPGFSPRRDVRDCPGPESAGFQDVPALSGLNLSTLPDVPTLSGLNPSPFPDVRTLSGLNPSRFPDVWRSRGLESALRTDVRRRRGPGFSQSRECQNVPLSGSGEALGSASHSRGPQTSPGERAENSLPPPQPTGINCDKWISRLRNGVSC
jgi:hypothetical protein